MNKPTRFVLIGLALAICLGAGIAVAQAGSGFDGKKRGGHHRGGSDHGAMSFEVMDGDGDGIVTREEMEALAATQFGEADSDGNGVISLEELRQAHERRIEQRRAERSERIYAMLDTDGDGALSQDEMRAAMEKRFERMDRNDDGVLTPRQRPVE